MSSPAFQENSLPYSDLSEHGRYEDLVYSDYIGTSIDEEKEVCAV